MMSLSGIVSWLFPRGRVLGGIRAGGSVTNPGALLEMVRSVVPPLVPDKHKGQDGRIGTVGGCQEYTGAPFFAAMTALKVGCDLSHVFCAGQAAVVIKSYSPELIVHPVLDRDDGVSEVEEWLPRLHCLIIGPGLGRDSKILNNVKGIIKKAKELNLPMVIDADGIYLLSENPELISNYSKAILTPNIVEFNLLYKKVIGREADPSDPVNSLLHLCKRLGNVTIVQKGKNDIISNGDHVLVCCTEGSWRRVGGQGDILAGSIATLFCWAHGRDRDRAERDRANPGPAQTGAASRDLELFGNGMCAAYGGCLLTRHCANLAYAKHGRQMTTTEMMKEIRQAFLNLSL